MDVVELADISVEDARNAGYESLDELVEWLGPHEGPIHRVTFHFAGPDPRIELRNRSDLNEDEITEIKARLAGFDRPSEVGPWTAAVSRWFGTVPGVRAPDLATSFGRDTPPFKRDVAG